MDLLDRKILIRADGDNAIGMGHIYRMCALGKAIEANGGKVVFLTLGNSNGYEMLHKAFKEVYPLVVEKEKAIHTKIFQSLCPDAVLIDLLDNTEKYLNFIRSEFTGSIIVFDDCKFGLRYADATINAIVSHWGCYQKEAALKPLFEGSQYMIFRQGIIDLIPKDKEIPKTAKNILIAMGGSDTRMLSPIVLRCLVSIDLPLKITVNLGPATEEMPELYEIKKNLEQQITIQKNVKSLEDNFVDADLVICSGGVMLWELAVLGVPSLSIAAEHFEVHNINYFRELGVTKYLGFYKNLKSKNLTMVIRNVLLDNKTRYNMMKKGREKIDGLGLQRCIRIINETINGK